jgi:hypothetical protein
MRRLLFVLVLLAAVTVGLGYYLRWFNFSTGGTDGKANATITVDQEKIKADAEKAKEKVQGFGQKVKERAGGATDTGKEEAQRP